MRAAACRAALAAVLAAAPLSAPPAQARAPAAAHGNRQHQSQSADARLMALFRADAEREERLDPIGVLMRGGMVDPAAFRLVFSDQQLRASRQSALDSLAALRRIDRRRLTAERRISFDVFLHDKRQQVALQAPAVAALTAVRPLNHFDGLHVEFPAMIARGGPARYADEADYRRNLALIEAFPAVLDNAILRFRQGIASGVVDTRLTTRNMIAQLDELLAQPLEQSPFYSPVLDFPAAVPEGRRSVLRAAYGAAWRDEVRPGYLRLRRFLADEYLPAAREEAGLGAMKGGAGLYRLLIARETTLDLDPDTVHRLGMAEVARIQHEMDGVRQDLGYGGTLREFFDAIRIDPRFHPRSAAQLAEGFAAVGHNVDALAPQYFVHLPRTPLLIQPYPAYREKYEAGGSYNQGSPDGRRPGIFFYNTYDLPSRFLSGITTLYLHEGAPGHHFQISLAQENTALPDFQRFGGNNAYVEGWALYAETLGYPMGLYDDPMQHWGTLDDEMLRAMRLVVDTGIHAKGWTREQAIDYMLANSGMGRSDATAEVERYIALPAQALSYKIGALTIQRLRRKAEQALGPRFDIRAFHEQVLGSGALPLSILEAKVDRWIAANRRRDAQSSASAISRRVLAMP